MDINIINAASQNISLGTKDSSKRVVPTAPDSFPTNLPKLYVFAQKGPRKPQIVSGAQRDSMFGADSFVGGSKFYNHATEIANRFNGNGSLVHLQRLFPQDMGPKANLLLSADVLPTTLTQFKRNADGTYLVDLQTGLPIPVTPAATVNGLKIKWVVTHIIEKDDPEQLDTDLFGIASQSVGDQVDSATNTTSTRIPILQWWAESEGELANRTGVSIWAPNTNSGVKTGVIEKSKIYPFRLKISKKETELSSSKVVQAEDGSTYVDFVLKPGAVRDPDTTILLSLTNVYPDRYCNVKDQKLPIKFADLQNFKIYQANIEALLSQIYTVEKAAASVGTDFDTSRPDAEQKWLVNPFSARSSSGVPYYAVRIDNTSTGSVALTESTVIYAKGGSDGTINDTVYDQLFRDEVVEYANENSYLLNDAKNPENSLWDSGLGLNAKLDLSRAISLRPDIGIVLGTSVANGPILSAAEDNAMGVTLRARIRNYPESTYWGTPAMRAIIAARSGELRDSLYTGRLPMTHELADKFSKFMGASSGIWDAVELFDIDPKNKIERMYNISNTYVPTNQKIRDWNSGLTVVNDFDYHDAFFPAVRTVYDDDTSVLTSGITVWGCIELQKVAYRVHRRLTGAIRYTEAQFCKRAEELFTKMTVGRFAGLFKIVPKCTIVGMDEQRGYSWTLVAQLYANNMKTVQQFYVDAFRMSDFAE